MKYKDCLVAWNPGTDQVRVGPLRSSGVPDWTRHPVRYRMKGGGAFGHVRECEDEFQLIMLMMLEFHTLAVRDKIPLDALHQAFLLIDEYRARISPDIPGADPADGWV